MYSIVLSDSENKDEPEVQVKDDFSGTIVVTMLADVVQLYALARHVGCLIVETKIAHEKGKIYFDKGKITHAEEGCLEGRDAFNSILARKGGSFGFVEGERSSKQTITTPTSELLMDALRIADEASMLEQEFDDQMDDDLVDQMFQEFISHASLPAGQAATDLSMKFISSTGIKPPIRPSLEMMAEFTLEDAPTIPSFESIDFALNRLDPLKELGGFIGACIGNIKEKKVMESCGRSDLKWKESIAAQCELLQQRQATFKNFGDEAKLENIVTNTQDNVEVIQPSSKDSNLFIYLLLDRTQANLPLAMFALMELEQNL